jgi:hypothetical protein
VAAVPRRLIDVPIESLPFVDERSIAIVASPDEVWEATLATVSEAAANRPGPRLARLLGCAHPDRAGVPGEIGSTLPGFVVARSVRPAVLALMGQHRFSRYALILRIAETPLEPVVLSAETRAEFPGRRGTAYRAAVIGSRGHRVAIEASLRAVRRRAEQEHVAARTRSA